MFPGLELGNVVSFGAKLKACARAGFGEHLPRARHVGTKDVRRAFPQPHCLEHVRKRLPRVLLPGELPVPARLSAHVPAHTARHCVLVPIRARSPQRSVPA